jgi:hypothetical protein
LAGEDLASAVHALYILLPCFIKSRATPDDGNSFAKADMDNINISVAQAPSADDAVEKHCFQYASCKQQNGHTETKSFENYSSDEKSFCPVQNRPIRSVLYIPIQASDFYPAAIHCLISGAVAEPVYGIILFMKINGNFIIRGRSIIKTASPNI